jgi:glycosyltransferase involved in cell wall biosynthesis
MVLETFIKLNPDNWKLVLIGPIEKQFTYYIENFYRKYPKRIKNRIIFTGPVYDKAILYEWYCKSNIFYLPSRWEGFSLALIEAMFFMNYLVVSRLDCNIDITDDGKYGKLVESDDLESNMQGLNYAINLPENTLFKMTSKVRKKTEEEYNWDKIASKIFMNLF